MVKRHPTFRNSQRVSVLSLNNVECRVVTEQAYTQKQGYLFQQQTPSYPIKAVTVITTDFHSYDSQLS